MDVNPPVPSPKDQLSEQHPTVQTSAADKSYGRCHCCIAWGQGSEQAVAVLSAPELTLAHEQMSSSATQNTRQDRPNQLYIAPASAVI